MATIASELTFRLEAALKRRGLSVHRSIEDRCDIVTCQCGWRIYFYLNHITDQRVFQVIKEIDSHACEKQVQKPAFNGTTMQPSKLYPVEYTPPVGWKCPTCNHGNAPWAGSCGNCAAIEWSKQPTELHLSKEQCAEIERMLTAPHS